MGDLISIIIPVYNGEKYLDKCLESVINQTYKNIEIILINDGSADRSLEILETYKKKDDRIVIVNRENKGVLHTRLEGFEKAKGKYITYMDSDDWAEKNMIEILYNKIIKFNADVVKCEFAFNESNLASGNLNIQQDCFIKKENFEPSFYDMFLEKMNIHTVWAQMFKKDLLYKFIQDIDTNIAMGDDLEINIQLYKNIDNILFIPEVLYHYRYNSNSITKSIKIENTKKNIMDITKSYFKAYKSIEYLNIKDKLKYKRAVIKNLLNEVNNYQINLIGALKNRKEAIKYLKWYYFEYENMIEIKNEMQNINFDINELRYGIFYKKIYTNMKFSYLIANLIYKRRILKRKIQRV